ncbi:MAG: hypothetical protein AAGA54_29750 [Myxococcota bacterium]
MTAGPLVTPWPVAEAIALRLARYHVRTVRIQASASARRIARVLPEAAPWDGALTLDGTSERVDAVVSVEDALDPAVLCRGRVLERASAARDVVVLCEPHDPGRGVGRSMLRTIDPGASELRCDEVPDGLGGTRMRTEVEPPAIWLVASVAAWRFSDGAESLRDGLCRRLPRMRVEQMLQAIRRVHAQWPRAFEVFALAAGELARRSDYAGLRRIEGELSHHPRAPGWLWQQLRASIVASTPAPALQPMAAAPTGT